MPKLTKIPKIYMSQNGRFEVTMGVPSVGRVGVGVIYLGSTINLINNY